MMRALRSLLVVAVVTGLMVLPTVTSAATLPSSTAGDVVFTDWTGPVYAWWTAVEGAEGTAGSFAWDQGIFAFVADVTCVAVVSPTEAYMGGSVTSSSDPSIVGKHMLTYVVDGGPSQTDDVLWSTASYEEDMCATLGTQLPVHGPFVVSGGDLTVSKEGLLASATSLTPSAKKAYAGDPINLAGRLGVAGETAEGRSISITRSVNGGDPTQVAAVTTGSDGTFEASDTMPLGTVVYTATFTATTTVLGSSESATVTFTKRVTKLALSASERKITFGQSITLTATLTGGDPGDMVAFFAQPAGDPKRRIGLVATNAAGKATFKVKPSVTTVYSATFKGSSVAAGSASPTVQVTVAVRWTAKAVGGYATSNGYRLYHYTEACPSSGNGCPTLLFALAPSHAGTRVTCEVQWYVGGRWRGDRIPFKLDDGSRLKLWHHYSDRQVIGVRRRIRVTFEGDGDHIGSTSAWVYWKVTD